MRNRWQIQAISVVFVIVLLSSSVIVITFLHEPVSRFAGPKVVPTSTPVPPPTDTLTLDVSLGAKNASVMGLGTNIQGWSDLAPTNGPRAQVAKQILASWKPKLVRVHVGFRGEAPISAPEQVRDVWDFSNLDNIISTLRDMNISYFLDIRTAPPWMYDNTGHLPVANFDLFARYMAEIVSWYNKGGFTDEAGTVHSSGHHDWVKTWEIWNEPKSGWDIPTKAPGYNPAAAPWMLPELYALLYDRTVTAMRAVDPTIQTGGPALNSYPDDTYFATFLQNETAPLDFFSFHFYAEYDPKNPDQHLFDAITGDRFLTRLANVQAYYQQFRPGKPPVPIWITELGINESSLAARDARGSAPIAYAFLADTFTTA
ncbi:MAG: cellulase family glycosylhydrolase, partial [Ktedonobacterales bacterium]|nr:cellulase family glycosylhydrolase [Ktedonobacterales bacterium]